MIAVLFEVFLKEEHKSEYLQIASKLKLKLEEMEGFISIERFASLQDSNKILSLSYWENEESIKQWRNLMVHREGQAQGRNHIFNDYRIRVGQIIRDYGMNERDQAPLDSREIHS